MQAWQLFKTIFVFVRSDTCIIFIILLKKIVYTCISALMLFIYYLNAQSEHDFKNDSYLKYIFKKYVLRNYVYVQLYTF